MGEDVTEAADVSDAGEPGSGAAGGTGPGWGSSGREPALAGLGGLHTDPAPGAPAPILVIGIGSPLRRDDAVGHAVVAALGERDLDGLDAVSVHQLTPEVAAALAGRELVVFVDAAVDTERLVVARLDTDASGRLLTHHLGAAGLLDLAAGLGWSPASAALVRVPVEDLGIGTGLSAFCQAQVEPAVHAVLDLLG